MNANIQAVPAWPEIVAAEPRLQALLDDAALEAPSFANAYENILAESLDDPERFASLAGDFMRYQVHLLEAMP